jgi:hypothetical protein
MRRDGSPCNEEAGVIWELRECTENDIVALGSGDTTDCYDEPLFPLTIIKSILLGIDAMTEYLLLGMWMRKAFHCCAENTVNAT